MSHSAVAHHFSPPRTFAATMGRQTVNYPPLPMSSSSAAQSPFIAPISSTNSKFVHNSRNLQKTISDVGQNAHLKPPKPPEKPLTPYMRYYRTVCEKVRLTHPDSKLWDVGKVVGGMWRELGDQEKQLYFDEYDIDKVEYDKTMKAYKISSVYLAYEQQLQKNKTMTSAAKPDKQPVAKGSTSNTECGVYIQPVDEDEGEDITTSLGHVAAYRYQRNHRLIMDIFSNMSVPDLRTVVNINRLAHARRQFRSLASHQKNSEMELEQIENCFKNKKRYVEEASKNFTTKLQKVSEKDNVVSEEKFDELVKEYEKKMMAAYADYKLKRAAAVSIQDSTNREVAYVLHDMIINVCREGDK